MSHPRAETICAELRLWLQDDQLRVQDLGEIVRLLSALAGKLEEELLFKEMRGDRSQELGRAHCAHAYLSLLLSQTHARREHTVDPFARRHLLWAVDAACEVLECLPASSVHRISAHAES